MFISPTVVGNAVIVGSCAGSVYALHRARGTPIWRYDTKNDGKSAQFHGEALILGDQIVMPADANPKAHVYSFQNSTGHVRWKIPFDQGVATTPLLVDGRIIVVSAEGEVAAVDVKDGNIVWRAVPAGRLKPIPFVQSPASASKRVFVADNTNRVFALDAARGATLWEKTLTARTSTALVIVGDMLVFGTTDGYMNWLSVRSGELKKRVRLTAGHPYGTPILASRRLFVLAAGDKGHLLALDAETGAIRWTRETSKEWTTYRPLVAGKSVIAGDADKNLCGFDQTTGDVQWCRSIGQVPRGLGISNDGVLYVGSLSGVVQALRIREIVVDKTRRNQ